MNRPALLVQLATFVLVSVCAASSQEPTQTADRWAPLRPFLGEWEGTSTGRPGNGTVRRHYRLVLRDQFIEVRNTSTYPPHDKSPKGEIHEDLGFFSFDRARKRFVLRQFHGEGFVNHYTADGGSTGKLVFTTESIENIPAGWRARETYVLNGPNELEELFELAGPGKDFQLYSQTTLKRLR